VGGGESMRVREPMLISLRSSKGIAVVVSGIGRFRSLSGNLARLPRCLQPGARHRLNHAVDRKGGLAIGQGFPALPETRPPRAANRVTQWSLGKQIGRKSATTEIWSGAQNDRSPISVFCIGAILLCLVDGEAKGPEIPMPDIGRSWALGRQASAGLQYIGRKSSFVHGNRHAHG